MSGLSFGNIYDSKMVIIEEDMKVEGRVCVGVKEAGTRGGGKEEEVDRWVVFLEAVINFEFL